MHGPAGSRNGFWRTATVLVASVAALAVACAPGGPNPPGEPEPLPTPTRMGSEHNLLGSDPESGGYQFWLSIAGPQAPKSQGDRIQSRTCLGGFGSFGCDPVTGANEEFEPFGYTFGVDADEVATVEGLRIEAFDAAAAPVGDRCGSGQLSTQAQLTELSAFYPDADRYVDGMTPWCTGDQATAGPSVPTAATTFVVRAPDDTPWTDEDNPVVDEPGCAPVTMPAVANGGPTIHQLLHPSDGVADDQAVVADDGRLTFVETFRRWAPVCTLPPAAVAHGTYIVQARSHAAAATPLVDLSAPSGGGANRFSLRASHDVYARGRMTTYVNSGPVPLRLVEVPPEHRGDTLRVELYDLEDANHFEIFPMGSVRTPHLAGCTATRDLTEPIPFGPDDCMVDLPPFEWSGTLLTIDVPVPADLECGASTCWMWVALSYDPEPADTVTWSTSFVDGGGTAPTTTSTTPGSSTSTTRPSTTTTTRPPTTTTSTTSTTRTTTTTLPGVPEEPGTASAYQNDPTHRGWVQDADLDVAQLTAQWSKTLPGAASYAVIARDTLVVASRKAPAPAGTTSYGTTVHAFDLVDGTPKWSVELGDSYYWAGLAYENGAVIALNGSGRVRSLDLETGAVRWEQQLPQTSANAAPVVRQNYVYVSLGGGTIHALNALTGGIVWSRNIGNGSVSSPAVDATGIYTSSPCDTSRVSLTGTLVWRLPRNCSGGGGKQVALDSDAGRLFVRNVHLGDVTRHVIVDTATGAVGPDIPAGSPYAVDDEAAFTVANGVLVKVDPGTGHQIWSMGGDVNDELVGPPLVVNDTVIVGGRSGRVYGISALTGAREWTSTVGAPVAKIDEQGVTKPTSSIAVGLGHVVVPTDTGFRVFAED